MKVLSKIKKNAFFELLQITLGNRDRLSRVPYRKEWLGLYQESEKQAVIGICFQGVQQLKEQQQYPPKKLLFQWFAVAEQIKKRKPSF